MMDYTEDEALVTCPYNSSHKLQSFRIQGHIIKCRKNYPNVQLSTCTYNATHLLKASEMSKHLEECPNKRRLEESRYLGQPLSVPYIPQPEYSYENDADFQEFNQDKIKVDVSWVPSEFGNSRSASARQTSQRNLDKELCVLESFDGHVQPNSSTESSPVIVLNENISSQLSSLVLSNADTSIKTERTNMETIGKTDVEIVKKKNAPQEDEVNYDNFILTPKITPLPYNSMKGGRGRGYKTNVGRIPMDFTETGVIGRGKASTKYLIQKPPNFDRSYLVPDISDLENDFDIPKRPIVGKFENIIKKSEPLSVLVDKSKTFESIEGNDDENAFLRSIKEHSMKQEQKKQGQGENSLPANIDISVSVEKRIETGRGRGYLLSPKMKQGKPRGKGRGVKT